ncbi:protease SohB [Enterobacteriaceae bacterium LUAb1]
MELLSSYGLFLVKLLTFILAMVAVVLVVTNAALRKKGQHGQLKLTDLSKNYREMKDDMMLAKMKHYDQKAWHKARKKEEKQEVKTAKQRVKLGQRDLVKPSLYVIDFKGGISADEVSSLREEVSAVLAVASGHDEVLLRLESPGGVVHGYGLAASHLQRLRDKGIRLTAAVDKVAASGGYMMACVADRIIAAPFAIIGSIGVVAQIPNFNRLLKRNDIDMELHTAGEYKRTLTMFGENTEQGRLKFREDLNNTHDLFKTFVHEMRPTLDITRVATGEYWFGRQALDKGLVDSLGTSDEVILAKMEKFDVIAVRYIRRKAFMDRFTQGVMLNAEKMLLKWFQRGEKPLL